MKKLFAYFNMIARHNLGTVMLILTLLTAVNAVVFHLILGTSAGELSPVLDSLGLYVIFSDAFILLSVKLRGILTDRGGHQNYFLARLRKRRMTLFWNQILYSTLCYGLLFAVEALSLVALCEITAHRFPESYNAQSVMLACYQSKLLHTFLPLSDWLGWVTTGVMTCALGITAAYAPMKSRQGKTAVSWWVMQLVFLSYVWVQRGYRALSLDYKLIHLLWAVLTAFATFAGACHVSEEQDV